MKNITGILLLAHLTIGCVAGDNDAPQFDAPEATPGALPRSCEELAKTHPKAVDGDFKLYIDGNKAKWFLAYCADLPSAPKTYLTVDPNNNWSQYTAGGRSPGATVTTRFDKIRIDPISFKVDPTDTTFAVSEGSLTDVSGAAVTEMTLGMAKSCGGGYATANVSLMGTPFFISNSFATAGDPGHVGYAGEWENHQVIEMWADGDCGWVAPNSDIVLTFAQ
jgi:hypothetical protein